MKTLFHGTCDRCKKPRICAWVKIMRGFFERLVIERMLCASCRQELGARATIKRV